MCYVMLGIALQYHYGHPGDRRGRDYTRNSPAKEKFENKRASKFGRQGTIRGNEILLQVATNKRNYSPKSPYLKTSTAKGPYQLISCERVYSGKP